MIHRLVSRLFPARAPAAATRGRAPRRRLPLADSLSGRLLLLTIAFVVLGEVLIYLPSIARYRLVFLETRLASAHLASLALEDRDMAVTPGLEKTLLANGMVVSVTLTRPGGPVLMLGETAPAAMTVDLRDQTPYTLIRDAVDCLLKSEPRLIRVLGPAPMAPEMLVDVLFQERDLRDEMRAYSIRILTLTIVLSAIVAALLYAAIERMMVRPMRQMAAAVMAFREAPEDAGRVIPTTRRADEIGIVQRELAMMQQSVRRALDQKTRLAGLGAAVAKLNHDLRNLLSTALLNADRIEREASPAVRRLLPPMIAALERAIALCGRSLGFATTETPAPVRAPLDLAQVAAEVLATVEADPAQGIADPLVPVVDGGPAARVNALTSGLIATADHDLIYRILANLVRNALEAMQASPPPDGGHRLTLSAARHDNGIAIHVDDTGPGLAPKAAAHLFEAFTGSTKPGGTGLGLAIARDLARAHGGDVRLDRSGTGGSRFTLWLPAEA